LLPSDNLRGMRKKQCNLLQLFIFYKIINIMSPYFVHDVAHNTPKEGKPYTRIASVEVNVPTYFKLKKLEARRINLIREGALRFREAHFITEHNRWLAEHVEPVIAETSELLHGKPEFITHVTPQASGINRGTVFFFRPKGVRQSVGTFDKNLPRY